MRNDHERKENGIGRRGRPTKDERIRMAALRLGPRFTSEDVATALKGHLTIGEVGRILAHADYARPSGRSKPTGSLQWELVEAEAR
jgi:hypothetical protein